MSQPLPVDRIRTIGGHIVSLLDPDPATIDLQDICWSLAGLRRFNAHTRNPWYVSNHAELVYQMMGKSGHRCSINLLGALLHDAHEAYTGDFPSPLIEALGPVGSAALKRIQRGLDEAIRRKLQLPVWDADIVHTFDIQARLAEADALNGNDVHGTVFQVEGVRPSQRSRAIRLGYLIEIEINAYRSGLTKENRCPTPPPSAVELPASQMFPDGG